MESWSYGHVSVPERLPVRTLTTERLILRPRTADDAGVERRLWTERDPRVPAHRQIDAQGRPTVADLADQICSERNESRPGLLAVERRSEGDVIGYCGLVVSGAGAPDEPELAFELLSRAQGSRYATEAGGTVLTWAAGPAGGGYERVWATVWAWNVASRRVLAKLGFHETGQVAAHPTHVDNLLTVRSLAAPLR